MEFAFVAIVIALALIFDFTNGFHDAANAVATSVSTRALTPRVALAMAALMNFVGAFLGQQVAETVGQVIDPAAGRAGLIVVAAGLIGAIGWNLITWWLGLPTSSTHAMLGGLVGAALAGGVVVRWETVRSRVLLPMLISPVIAFVAGIVVMLLLYRLFRNQHPAPLNRGFRLLQTFSAAAMALGHGLQDAQKTMGVMVLALVTGGYLAPGSAIPWWVILTAATAISLGTYSGGWRIMRTLGRRIFDLDPPSGFAAESIAAGVLYGAAAFSWPISTTQTITSAVMGVGVTKRLSAVRWLVVRNIVLAWLLTFPMAMLLAAAAYAVLGALG